VLLEHLIYLEILVLLEHLIYLGILVLLGHPELLGHLEPLEDLEDQKYFETKKRQYQLKLILALKNR
jgi:hypothetical protein